MDCIYFQELQEKCKEISIEGKQIKHLKALRIKIGEKIMLTNGKGISAVCSLINFDKNEFSFNIEEFIKNHGELPNKLGLALGILSDKNRMELTLEKAVELGATDFYPLITRYSEKKEINLPRLQSKAISALEQCKRSHLIQIHEPIELKKIFSHPEPVEGCNSILSDYENIILADENGENPDSITSLNSTLCFVGPEGGFSLEEIEMIKKTGKTICWNLGNRRLRAETASISILSFASVKIGTDI
jgi:16S rRNA (uracil1498-N3)-methyltransferase